MIKIIRIPKELDEHAFVRLIQKYARTKNNIDVLFDRRMVSTCGSYDEIQKNNRLDKHQIKISPISCEVRGNKKVTLFLYISTLLHELRHLQQREKLGSRKFHSKEFGYNESVFNSNFYSENYSKCEIDARLYENKNIWAAFLYYNKICKMKHNMI